LFKQLTSFFFPHDGKPDHFKALDGLRGLAILIVLLSHTSNRGLMFNEYLNFSHSGKFGVYLFFVLSAYLLDRQITIAFMSGKSSKKYWLNYFLRRFLRIYPLFIVALIVHWILTNIGYGTVIDKAMDIPMHILLLRGEYIFWSIPIEFKYYFISPLILWGFHRFFKWEAKRVIISLILLTIVTITIELLYNIPAILTLKYFPIFLAGTLIAVLEVIKGKAFFKKIPTVVFDMSGILASILIILTIPFYTQSIFGTTVDFYHSAYFFPFGVLWGAVLMASKYGKRVMKWIFELWLLRFLGTISFSMYLFHIPVIKVLVRSRLGIPDYLMIYVVFLAVILVSMISYLLIERPLSKVKIYRKPLREEEIQRGDR